MKNVNVFYYIAEKNLDNSIKLLKELGYPKPVYKDNDELKLKVAGYLADYWKKNKTNPDTILSFINIHPDTAMIEKGLLIKSSRAGKKEEPKTDSTSNSASADSQWSNCSACGLLADGNAAQPASKLTNQQINMIIVGGSLVLLTSLVAIMVLNKN